MAGALVADDNKMFLSLVEIIDDQHVIFVDDPAATNLIEHAIDPVVGKIKLPTCFDRFDDLLC
jgi:hypothetical protein